MRSRSKRTVRILPLLLLFLAFTLVRANPGRAAEENQPKLALQTLVAKEIIVQEAGRAVSRRVPPDTAISNDTLVYTISYVNEGRALATDAVIIDPIPAQTVYLPDSAVGAGTEISFSIDNGRNFQPEPVMYTIKRPDNTSEKVKAPPEMYTHIKWMINKKLQPGQTGEISFKVRIK